MRTLIESNTKKGVGVYPHSISLNETGNKLHPFSTHVKIYAEQGDEQPMKYNHMYDVAFTIESNNEEENVTVDELIEGVEKRLVQLKSERDIEAYGLRDTFGLNHFFESGEYCSTLKEALHSFEERCKDGDFNY
jgi:hypothetical protein